MTLRTKGKCEIKLCGWFIGGVVQTLITLMYVCVSTRFIQSPEKQIPTFARNPTLRSLAIPCRSHPLTRRTENTPLSTWARQRGTTCVPTNADPACFLLDVQSQQGAQEKDVGPALSSALLPTSPACHLMEGEMGSWQSWG